MNADEWDNRCSCAFCRYEEGTTTNAVLEIKCGSSVLRDIWIMGAFAAGYEAGAHWYTNNLNLWQPEFNRIEGMQFWWLVIGMAVGALPSQPSCCAWQGVIVPDSQATNCPLSESSMSGLEFYGTVEALHYEQPNGYLQITDSTIGVTPLGWTGSIVYPGNDSVALHIRYGSLNVVNCDLENTAGEQNSRRRIIAMIAIERKQQKAKFDSALHVLQLKGGNSLGRAPFACSAVLLTCTT